MLPSARVEDFIFATVLKIVNPKVAYWNAPALKIQSWNIGFFIERKTATALVSIAPTFADLMAMDTNLNVSMSSPKAVFDVIQLDIVVPVWHYHLHLYWMLTHRVRAACLPGFCRSNRDLSHTYTSRNGLTFRKGVSISCIKLHNLGLHPVDHQSCGLKRSLYFLSLSFFRELFRDFQSAVVRSASLDMTFDACL